MKSTEYFKQTIQAYFDDRAQTDELFAPVYSKPNKNIDDCITFILNQVKSSGCNGFTDAEIYSLALHYYDEDGIDTGKPLKCNVVVNHTVVLTEEEKALILSATLDGKRIETIEVSSSTLKVIQARGLCNKITKHHSRIVKLVNDNMNLIQ